jgi:uncharacterized protein (TIGR02001 family)
MLLMWFSNSAQCQMGVGLSVESDYLFRGVSLSNEKPNLRLSLAYDHSTGWYAGAAATRAEQNSQPRQYQVLAYLGYARRWLAALSWEVGATAAHFTGDSGDSYYGKGSDNDDYGEVYTGLISERWNLRAYYSPNYYGNRQRTTYLELNGGLPLDPPMRLVGHLGALTGLGADTQEGTRRVRYDIRLGLARSVGAWDAQFAWFAVGRESSGFRSANAPRHSGPVLSISYFF